MKSTNTLNIKQNKQTNRKKQLNEMNPEHTPLNIRETTTYPITYHMSS